MSLGDIAGWGAGGEKGSKPSQIPPHYLPTNSSFSSGESLHLLGSRCTLASGPLHLLFPLPKLFPWLPYAWLSHHLQVSNKHPPPSGSSDSACHFLSCHVLLLPDTSPSEISC